MSHDPHFPWKLDCVLPILLIMMMMRMFDDILDLYCACLQGARSIFACSRLINPHVAVKHWMQVMFVMIFSLVQSLWLEEGPVSSAALCGETGKRDAFCALLPAPLLSASVSTTVRSVLSHLAGKLDG